MAEGEGEGAVETREQRCSGNLQKLGIRSEKWRAHRGLNLELVVGEGDNGRAREQRGNQEKLVHGGGANSLWFERNGWKAAATSAVCAALP